MPKTLKSTTAAPKTPLLKTRLFTDMSPGAMLPVIARPTSRELGTETAGHLLRHIPVTRRLGRDTLNPAIQYPSGMLEVEQAFMPALGV